MYEHALHALRSTHPFSGDVVIVCAALYSGGTDKALAVIDVETGKVSVTVEKAHSHAINKLKVYDANYVVSGGDEGDIKV
jgi:hypothetical protein